MPENRSLGSSSCGRETVCIGTYRVLDSCRDKDCFEDVRVFLTDFGQELISHTQSVRTKSAEIIWATIDVNSVPFNRGFYQINIRIFVRITCEVCVNGSPQEIVGIAAVEKRSILFASEGNVSIFRSDPYEDNFCRPPVGGRVGTNLPVAVLETVDPIILNSKIVDPPTPCSCCCRADDVPGEVVTDINGTLIDPDDDRFLTVSLGFFSVVRIERPAQYLIEAAEYTVPDKECVSPENDDPCVLFRTMSFPVNEFYPPSFIPQGGDPPQGGRRCCP
ncbi:MAG: hypothetical protein LUH59_04050 [Firmicutes bacterium]|nr:hypothetical protein [Bacillota bacterium]